MLIAAIKGLCALMQVLAEPDLNTEGGTFL
jgi:hypothetical protein